MNQDWSELTVLLYPLSRELEQALNMDDWVRAHDLAERLYDLSHELFKITMVRGLQ